MLKKQDRINDRSRLKEWLAVEVSRYPCGKTAYFFGLGEAALLKKHTILLRKAEFYLNTGRKFRYLLYKTRLRKLQMKYSLHIPFNCCAKGFHIVHLGPILINNNATLGENLSLHMNTAIVAGGTDDSVPTVGNNVIVGYGAVLLGGITIADNVAIGANAVVNKSVERKSVTVAGVPAKIISERGTEEWNKKAKGL